MRHRASRRSTRPTHFLRPSAKAGGTHRCGYPSAPPPTCRRRARTERPRCRRVKPTPSRYGPPVELRQPVDLDHRHLPALSGLAIDDEQATGQRLVARAHEEMVRADARQVAIGHTPGAPSPTPRTRHLRLAPSLPGEVGLHRPPAVHVDRPSERLTVEAIRFNPSMAPVNGSYSGSHTVSGSGPRNTPLAISGGGAMSDGGSPLGTMIDLVHVPPLDERPTLPRRGSSPGPRSNRPECRWSSSGRCRG